MVPVALELVGDWTSARLLVRLLYAIESPWEPGERGLVCVDTGETCQVTMRGPDPKLSAAFRAGDDPVQPSLTDRVLEAIDGHHSVLRVTPDEQHRGEDALRAVARCAAGLVNAGGIGVWCPSSGAAHDADRFQAQVAELDAAEDPAIVRDVLCRLFVRRLVPDVSSWRTVGMGLLDAPEVACPRDLPDALALEAIDQVVQAILLGRPPPAGREVRLSGRAAPLVVSVREAEPGRPHGTVWLSRV